MPVTNAFGSLSRTGMEDEHVTVSLNHSPSLYTCSSREDKSLMKVIGWEGVSYYWQGFFDFDTSSDAVRLAERALLPTTKILYSFALFIVNFSTCVQSIQYNIHKYAHIVYSVFRSNQPHVYY